MVVTTSFRVKLRRWDGMRVGKGPAYGKKRNLLA
jgi:hypothetical protein